MKKFVKNLIVFILAMSLISSSVFAGETAIDEKEIKNSTYKTKAIMSDDFSLMNAPSEVRFAADDDITLPDGTIIPAQSIIHAAICEYQKEKRFHRSGFFICELKSYTEPVSGNIVDISNKEMYFIARKYEKTDAKDAAFTSAEFTVSTAAGFILPGVDIGYYFVKGAIQRKKDPNWFRAGVSNAYDNSILWLVLKGRPIELYTGDEISLKSIDKEKAEKLKIKIDKKHKKEAAKLQKKETKKARSEAI